MNKINSIINKMFDGRLDKAVIAYIVDKGWTFCQSITDEKLDAEITENAFMTKYFQIALVKTAREICKTCDLYADFFPYIAQMEDKANLELWREDFSDATWEEILQSIDAEDEEIISFTISGRISEKVLDKH